MDQRAGTWRDAALCAGIGVLAVLAGAGASSAGGSPTVAAVVAAVVAAAGLLVERLDRGAPSIDTYDLEARVGYRRQMALKLTPIAICGTWIVLVAELVDSSGLAASDAAELIALATAVVGYSVTERLAAARIAPRADGDDAEFADAVRVRLALPDAPPQRVGWRRGRQVAVALPFLLATAGGIAGIALAEGDSRIFFVLWTALFGYVSIAIGRAIVTRDALSFDPAGVTLTLLGTVPWSEVEAVGIRRHSFVLYLDVLLADGPRDYLSRGARRQTRRRSGVLSMPLLNVDALPEDLLAAFRARDPEVLVLLPGPGGDLVTL